MKQNGFSLVELVTVLSIISILLAIGTLGFNSMQRKYGIDNQTRTLYADLMEIRVKSMYKKKSHYVALSAGTFVFYSSGSRTNPVGEILRKRLAYPVIWNGTASNLIEFNSQGLTNDLRSICVDQIETAPHVDSIVVATARVNMGKRKVGKDCDADFIDIK
jgi:prepilin-type N-terminal cleavage/methylation domain-containing protein